MFGTECIESSLGNEDDPVIVKQCYCENDMCNKGQRQLSSLFMILLVLLVYLYQS